MNKQYNCLTINGQQIYSSYSGTNKLKITETQDELSINSQIITDPKVIETFTLTKNTNTKIERITYKSPCVRNVNMDASFIKNANEFLEGQINYISINGYIYHIEFKNGIWTISYYNRKGQLIYTFTLDYNVPLTEDNFQPVIESVICEILTLNIKNKIYHFLIMDNPADIINNIQKSIIQFLQSLLLAESNQNGQHQIDDETKEYLSNFLTKLTKNTYLMRLLEHNGE